MKWLPVLLMFCITTVWSAPYVVVNRNNFTLEVIDGGELQEFQRVIVGMKSRPTPVMKDLMTHIVINPSWTVPNRIARLDVVPQLQKNPALIDKLGYMFFETQAKQKQVDPKNIPWELFDKRTQFPYTIVQKPGPTNALGHIKFILSNKRSIFMHGTPKQHLFEQKNRRFSSGCIRLENPTTLAEVLLPEKNIKDLLKRKGEIWLRLSEPILVIVE